jgi:hypothetical protein
MLILTLVTLALSVAALAYHTLLVVTEVAGWSRPTHAQQNTPQPQQFRLTTLELRFATQELGRLPGFGDD